MVHYEDVVFSSVLVKILFRGARFDLSWSALLLRRFLLS